jgi:hypothetical protein
MPQIVGRCYLYFYDTGVGSIPSICLFKTACVRSYFVDS